MCFSLWRITKISYEGEEEGLVSEPYVSGLSIFIFSTFILFEKIHLNSVLRTIFKICVFFSLGGHLEQSWPIFFQWHRSSSVRVQISREVVRLITLISLNKFLIKLIFPNRLKKFYGQLFDALSSMNIHFWRFIGFKKNVHTLPR